MKKIIILLLCLVCIFSITPVETVVAITDEEFSQNETYYKNLCTNNISSNDRNTCYEYQTFVNKKVADQKQQIQGINDQLSAVQGDITEQGKILQKQIEIIKQAETEIESLKGTIATIELNIKIIEEDMKKRQGEIDRLNEEIKHRVAAQQPSMHRNLMIDFIFGTSSLTEMARRIFVVNKITAVDQEKIDEFTQQKELLKKDQEEAEKQKQLQKETLDNVELLKTAAEEAKVKQEAIIAEFKQKEAELIAIQSSQTQALNATAAEVNAIQSSIELLAQREEEARRAAAQQQNDDSGSTPSTPSGTTVLTQTGNGWIYPVSGGFYVSAGSWYYPASFGGGVHYGVDMAGAVGQPIVSTGPGIVVKSFNGCSTYGFLGNSCGSYWGNHVFTIVSVNGKLYALIYGHLQSAYVSTGQVIEQGTQLGTLGSSGNSTGSHLHHEVIYLGDMSLQDYLSTWNGYTTFTPSGEWMDLNWTCDVKGAPCRINPQAWYGVSVGVWY